MEQEDIEEDNLEEEEALGRDTELRASKRQRQQPARLRDAANLSEDNEGEEEGEEKGEEAQQYGGMVDEDSDNESD